MACTPPVAWAQAKAACEARTAAALSVKGFGYVRTGYAGLGDLNTSGDPNDACVIAAQAPCTTCPASCPPGWVSGSFTSQMATSGRPQCSCFPVATAPNAPSASLVTSPSSGSAAAPASSASQASVAGGFNHWGLLAALAAGGAAIYLVARKRA